MQTGRPCRRFCIQYLRLQTQEVLDANWATLPQILQLLKEERFVPYYPQLVQLWFAMKGRFGSTTHE